MINQPAKAIEVLDITRGISEKMRDLNEPEEAFEVLADELRKVTGADYGAVGLIELGSSTLRIVGFSGVSKSAVGLLPPVPVDEAFRRKMVENRRPVAKRFASVEELPAVLHPIATALDVGTVVISSVVARNDFLGYLAVGLKKGGSGLPPHTEAVMEVIADHTAMALDLLRASIELTKAKEEGDRVFSIAPIGIMTCDAKGIVKSLNKQMLQMLDKSSEAEMVGTSVFEHGCVNRSGLESLFMQGMDGHEGERPDLHLVLRPDKAIYIHAKTTPIKNEKGAVAGVLLVAMDITSKVRLQSQLERSYEKLTQTYQELERVAKMKTQFIDVVSHELRTPLTVMRGYIDLMDSEYSARLDPRFSARLKTIKANTDRLYSLVESMLDVSRLEKGSLEIHPEPTRVDSVLEETVSIRFHDAEAKKQTLTLDIEGTLPLIMADRRRLKDVFNNLVDNAIKYTQEGGRISVSARDEGRLLHIWVRDNGVGIPLDQLGKLFDRFHIVTSNDLSHQVDRLGLGLPISKGIVEAHGGRIWVESQVGKGSVFHVDLPKEAPK